MKKINITKDNWRKFTKSALMPDAASNRKESVRDREEIDKNVQLLSECAMMYNSLQEFRDRRDECVQYNLGNQLGRLVPDPDTGGSTKISIKQYAINQGMTPLQMNLITSRIRSMVGSYQKQKLEDLALARDSEKAELGEMMSAGLQYLYQNNNLYRVNADGYREFLIGALPCFRTGYDFDKDKKISDVYVELEDINVMFWDTCTYGLYFKNISTIGRLHEFTLLEILSKFAKTPKMRRQIIDAFNEVSNTPEYQQFSKTNNKRQYSFYTPENANKFRVIEVWKREEHEVYVCTDPLGEEPYIIDVEQLDDIIAENNNRIAQIVSYGGTPDEAATIDYEYRVDSEWIVRFLTPCGHVLYQAVSPYAHGSHPWALGGYPMVNGIVQSLVYDLIPAQDMVNRLVMRMEFIRMNQAKGFGIIEKEALEDSDMTEEEFAHKYTSPKGLVALRTQKFGGVNNVFARFNDEGGAGNDYQMLQTYIEMINQQSGSTGASRGENGGSHTSASRYMMETENSNNNTCDGEQWYNGLLLVRDMKIMQLMQQHYNNKRYMAIAGSKYSEQAKMYDPDRIKQTQFDLAIIQQPSSGVVRMLMNDTINTALQYGAIDGNTALDALEMYGIGDLRSIKQRNDEKLMQKQAAMQQQAALQQQQADNQQQVQPQQ